MCPTDEKYTAKQMAEILHIVVRTLYDNRWREQSGCPLFKQGNKLFAWKKEFDVWYNKRLQYV